MVLCVWALPPLEPPEVVKFAAIVGGFGALPYLLMSGWLQNAHVHSSLISRQSVWNAIGSFVGNGDLLRTLASNGATVIAGALLARDRDPAHVAGTPELAIAAGLASFLVASSWVMPWYAFTGAPAARAAPAEPAELDGRALLVAGAARRAVPVAVGVDAIGSIGHLFLQDVLPVAALVCCVDRDRVPAPRSARRRARRRAGRRDGYGRTKACSIGVSFCCVSTHSASGSEPATIPAPAWITACATVDLAAA